MKFAKILIFLSACALLAGCSKSSNTNNAGVVSNKTSTTTTTTASPKANVEATKSPSESTTTAAKKPEDAAKGLFEAWKTKDRTAAAKFATDAAINSLYSEGGPEGLQFQGCDKADEGGYTCGYSYEGGGLIMHVSGSESGGYKVDSTEFIAD